MFCFSSLSSFSQEVRRSILALWDSDEYDIKHYDQTFVHQKLEVIFNYYGYKVEYFDISKGIPKELQSEKVMDNYFAIVSWFEDDKRFEPYKFLDWLDKQISHKKKIVFLNTFGFYHDKSNNDVSRSRILKTLSSLGLTSNFSFFDNEFLLDIQYKNSSMVEFERSLKRELKGFNDISIVDKKNKSHLKIIQTKSKDTASDLVITGPFGGYADRSYVLYLNPTKLTTEWRLNPFLFLEEALNLQKLPAPDTTTLFGKRIFYSHVDADGFANAVEFDESKIAAEVMYNDIFKKYHLPFTSSVITAEVNPTFAGNKRTVNIAKKIFDLPNIEIGSHSFSHPLLWIIESKRKLRKFTKQYQSNEFRIYKIKDYTFNFADEIVNSTKYINENLAPKNKKVEIFHWTGDCKPSYDAVKTADNTGLLNINGGDSRFDNRIKSYSHVAPLYRKVEDALQFYSSSANDFVYTNELSGPFSGYKNVLESFENTERPRRLKPINAYFHFFSGERTPSLLALKEVLDSVSKQNIFPIKTSEFIKIIKGFINAKIDFGNNVYTISQHQPLRTFRMDKNINIDVKGSENIVGFKEINDSKYVFTGSADTTRIKISSLKEINPYISSANLNIENLKFIDKSSISFTISDSPKFYNDNTFTSEIEISSLKANSNYKITIISKNTGREYFTDRKKTIGENFILKFKPQGESIIKIEYDI